MLMLHWPDTGNEHAESHAMQNATIAKTRGIYENRRKVIRVEPESEVLCDHSMKIWNMAFELDTLLPQPSTTHSLNGLVVGVPCFSFPLAEALMDRLDVHSPQYICRMG